MEKKNLRVTLYESRRQSAGNKQNIHVCFGNLYTPSTPTHKQNKKPEINKNTLTHASNKIQQK